VTVTFDVVGPSSSGANGGNSNSPSSLTWSHTCGGGSNEVLYVGATFGNNGGSDASQTLSATYNGVAMTSVSKVHSNSGTSGFIEVFRLVAPASGAHNVVVTVGGSGGSVWTLTGGSMSFDGVDQATPESGISTNTGTSNATVTRASATGNMVAFFVGSGDAPTSPTQTSRWSVAVNNISAAGNSAGQTAAGAASVTGAWTISGGDWFGIVGINVNAASGGAVALDGQSSGATTTSADAIVSWALAAQSDGTTTPTASLTVTWALDAQADGATVITTAALGLALPLSGQVDGASAVSAADVVVAWALGAQADGSTTPSADAIVAWALGGQSDGTTTPVADAIVAWALGAQSDGVLSVATADLTVAPSGSVTLDGQSDGIGGSTAALTLTLALTGQSDGAGTASGDVGLTLALSAQSDGALAVTSATLTVGGAVLGSFGTLLGSGEFYGQLPGESWNDAAYRWWSGFPYS
jgi:hypothetical protein